MKLALIWQGFDGRYGQWRDGLWAAMKLIEKENEVRYFDFPLEGIHDFKPDIVLYWEAPCTLKGGNAKNYQSVLELPYKKALLFAGGPVEATTCYGFDLFFVESKVNEDDFERLGLPWKRAFGVNTEIMHPITLDKRYDGFLPATFADWKRHALFADALGDKGAVAGRLQEHDRNGYNRCTEKKVNIFGEQDAQTIAVLINESHLVVNTSSEWGGGQRATLESMACGVPVIVMSDSPKNREYVEESGAGFVVEPTVEAIRETVERFILLPQSEKDVYKKKALDYIRNKWTERHYADAILDGISNL